LICSINVGVLMTKSGILKYTAKPFNNYNLLLCSKQLYNW
jgi:hypothetical protein